MGCAGPASGSPAVPRSPGRWRGCARSARTSPAALSLSAPAPPPRSADTRHAVATARLRSGSQGVDPFKRANGIPGDPLRENSPCSRSPAAAASPLPAPRGRQGRRGPGVCERASERRGAGGRRSRRRSPPSPAAPARRPPARPPFRRAGRRAPQRPSPGRAPREGEAAAAAALTIAGRQALPGARVPMARTRGLGFTSIPLGPVPPFSGPPRLLLLPVFPRLPLARPLRVSLSPPPCSPPPRSGSSPPPPWLQRERKV